MSEVAQELVFDLRKLKYERLSRNITSIEMGRVLGISSNAYYKKERGETNITLNDFCKILTVMDIPRSDIHSFFTGQV